MKMLQKVDSIANELADLEAIYAWEVYLEQERLRDSLQAQLDKQGSDALPEAESKVKELQTQLEACQARLQEKNKFLDSFGEKFTRLDHDKTKATAEKKECTRKVSNLEKMVERLLSEIDDQKKSKEQLEDALKQFNEQEEAEGRSSQAANLKYTLDLERASEKLKVTRNEEERIDRAIKEINKEITHLEAQITAVQTKKNVANSKCTQLKRDLNQMMSGASSKASRFGGARVPDVLKLIGSAVAKGEFHHPPIGPIGQHLGLKNNKFAKAVEVAIGPHLNTFLVRDKHDFQSLRKIFRQCGLVGWDAPRISIMNLQSPQYTISSNNLPANGIASVYSMLVCDDAVKAPIMNYLVDMGRVDRMALTQSREEQKAAARDKNVSVAYDLDGGKAGQRGKTRTYESNKKSHVQPRLGVSVKALIAGVKEALAHAEQEVDELVQQERDLSEDIKKFRNDVVKMNHDAAKCRKAKIDAQSQLEMLTTQPDPDMQSNEDGTDAIHNEIITAAQNVVALENKMADQEKELEKWKQRKIEAEQEYSLIVDAIENLGESNTTLVDGLTAMQNEFKMLQRNLEDAEREKDTLKSNAEMIEKEIKSVEEILEATLTQVMDICSREDADTMKRAMIEKFRSNRRSEEDIQKLMSKDMLDKRLTRAYKQIAEAEKEAGGSLKSVQSELATAKKALGGEGAEKLQLLEIYNKLRESHADRRKKFKEVDESVEKIVTRRFNYYMKKKGHYGRIKLKRQERKLEISVRIGEKNAGRGSGTVKDLKQLSGGERSFATVAFALALGGETEMPFRAMDEFDVFMDSVNRRIAMENLITFAIENPNLQFIFLTPQDITSVFAARDSCRKNGHDIPDDFIQVVSMKPARP